VGQLQESFFRAFEAAGGSFDSELRGSLCR
jgi:hypothetical protein